MIVHVLMAIQLIIRMAHDHFVVFASLLVTQSKNKQYRIVGNFCTVQNFVLCADGLYSYRKNKNHKRLNTEKAQKLKPRKFLLEVIYTGESAKLCTSENFPLYGSMKLISYHST